MAILADRKMRGNDKITHDDLFCNTMRSMGQHINLFSNQDEHVEAKTEQLQQRIVEMQQLANAREQELRVGFESLSVKELLASILEAQMGRVATYRDFDQALEQVLLSGNLTDYPSACSSATASFSILSNTINLINNTLNENHGRTDLKKLINQLQRCEKEKLNLTAALHLERIRENNEKPNNSDPNTLKLLSQGVVQVQKKLSTCVDEINEILEELKYAASES